MEESGGDEEEGGGEGEGTGKREDVIATRKRYIPPAQTPFAEQLRPQLESVEGQSEPLRQATHERLAEQKGAVTRGQSLFLRHSTHFPLAPSQR